MNKRYKFLKTTLPAIMAMLLFSTVFYANAQISRQPLGNDTIVYRRGAIDTTRIKTQPPDRNFENFRGRAIDTTAIKPRLGGNPNPNPGSIHVNRDPAKLPLTPEQLVKQIFLQEGLDCSSTVSNVKFYGYGWDGSVWTQAYDRGLSYFSHGTPATVVSMKDPWENIYYDIVTGLGMEEGLLLTTKGGRDAEGPNELDNGLGSSNQYNIDPGEYLFTSDPDIMTLATGIIYTGAVLEFDFIPIMSEMNFDYIFASEEYPEYVHTLYNDVFGFFVSEVDGSGNVISGTTQNIALLPTTNSGLYVVSINNVNNGSFGRIPSTGGILVGHNDPWFFPPTPGYQAVNPTNPQYYVANYQFPVELRSQGMGQYMEYDGRTVLLTARVTLTPGQKYRLKLAVANIGDCVFGSGVFLRSGSFNLGNVTQPDPDPATICTGGTHTFNLGAASGGAGTISYQWQESADNSSWSDIMNATNQNYTTPALSGNMYYRRVATADICGASTSAPALVTVNPNPSPQITAASAYNICSGDTINLPLGSNIVAYTWTVAASGVTGASACSSGCTDHIEQTITLTSSTTSSIVTYNVTATLNGCTATKAIEVTVNSCCPKFIERGRISIRRK